MTTNEALAKQNFLTKVIFKDGDKELSRDLKVKIMGMRIKMNKIRKEFDEDVQEFVKTLTPEGYQELAQNNNRSEEENARFNEMNDQINSDYNAFINKRSQEEVNQEFNLTEDELVEIMDVNVSNDVEINGQKLSAPDFLEILYTLFNK